MLLPERHCKTCTRQAEWGCDAHQELDADGRPTWVDGAAMPLEIDEEEVHRCPRRPILDDPRGWERLLTYNTLYQRGFLPDAGGVSEQSAKGIAMLRMLAIATDDCIRDAAEQQQKRQAMMNVGRAPPRPGR